MKGKAGFIKLLQFWGVIFLTGIGVSIIICDIFLSNQDFHSRAGKMRSDYIARQKQTIKQEVNRVVRMIKYEKAQSEAKTKEKIKSRVYEAYAIAQNINKQNNAVRSKAEIQRMILDALQPIRFAQEKGYYFISQLDGVTLLFPSKPEMEGKNLINVQDTHQQFITKDLLEIAGKYGEGFYEYHWTKPDAKGNDYKKISFVKRFKPLEWIIGSGLYVDDVENQIKTDLLLKISRIRFGREGYIFVNRLNGDALVYNGKLIGGTEKLWEVFNSDPEKMKKIFTMEHDAAMRPEGDYIYYSHFKLSDPDKQSPKASFIYGIPELQWLVGAGVYLDDVEADIAVMHAELRNHIKTKLLYFTLIVIGIVTIFLLFFNRLTSHLKNDFNLFISFFNQAAHSDKEIRRDLVQFDELDRMAENANIMLRDKIQAQKELKAEKERLFVTIRSIGEAVIATDTSGRVVLMNMVAEKFTGRQLAEAKGKPLAEIFRIVNAQTLEEAENPVEQVIEHVKIVDLANHAMLIARDGVKYQIVHSASPIRDNNGKITGVVLVFRDVTKKYRMREKLRQNEQFLNSVFESIQDGISILNLDLTIRHVNGVMNKWYAGNIPLEGKKCFKCYHNADKPCAPCPTLRCLESGKTEMDVVPGPPGSKMTHIELYSYPIKEAESGEITGVIEFVRDISEKKRTEEELQKMEKLKGLGVLAGGIAHDFNNILMGLFGNISLAKDELSEDHPARKSLENAENSMNRAVRLTRQLLTFAKGGAPIREDVSLGELVEDIVSFDLSGSNIKLILEQAEDLCPAKVDMGQIQQVFSNLTINAGQAMPHGGYLYITMVNRNINKHALPGLSPGKYIKITVRDEGTGIEPKHLERIFDPYFTTKETGNGLGLATVYSIINRHGGGIDVKSEPGRGTIFTLYLPASESKRLPKAEKPANEPESKGKQGKILVMDDEEIIRDVASRILARNGYLVETADKGQQAVKMYRQAMDSGKPFDAVIMDLTIPGGMGGKEAVKEILAIAPDAKAIVSSGYADDRIRANYTEYGFKDIVSKPYSIGRLLEVLNRVLEK